jgi:hypothetical protein
MLNMKALVFGSVLLAAHPAYADLLDCPSDTPSTDPNPGSRNDQKKLKAFDGPASDGDPKPPANPDNPPSPPSPPNPDPAKPAEPPVPATTSSFTGISDSSAPSFTFLADANASSVDLDKLAVGAGLELALPFTLARITVRKSTENTITRDVGSRAFGNSVLAPGTASFSVSGRYERRLRLYHRGCKVGKTAHIHSKFSHGPYGAVEAARVKLEATCSDGTLISGFVTPLALSVGYMARLEGRLPDGLNLGSSTAVVAPYAG